MRMRIRTHVGTAAWLLALLASSMTLLLTVGTGPTAAYEGPFCAEEMRAEGEGCESVSRSSIRRAVGHTKDAYSDVAIEAGGEVLGGDCRTIECQANTGYLAKDGTGNGYVWNEGPNGSRKVSGYLYP
jgi:hypothetical protein